MIHHCMLHIEKQWMYIAKDQVISYIHVGVLGGEHVTERHCIIILRHACTW